MLELDLTGLNCPLPVLKTKKFLSSLESGTEVKITTTGPASAIDLQDFCHKTGHVILSQLAAIDLITTIIKRK